MSIAANLPTDFFVSVRKRPLVVKARRTAVRLSIVTLEGTMIAEPGDIIIQGVKGEQYPCKPDIFDLTYEMTA